MDTDQQITPAAAPATPPAADKLPPVEFALGLTPGRAAVVLANSGLFGKNMTVDQAMARLIIGKDMGLTTIESLTQLFVFDGNIGIGASARAAACLRAGVQPKTLVTTDDCCTIEFVERATGDVRGTATFTMDEAKRAGIAGKNNWKAWPSDMLYARALSRGQRRFVPEAFGSGVPVYDTTSGELDEARAGTAAREGTAPTPPATLAERAAAAVSRATAPPAAEVMDAQVRDVTPGGPEWPGGQPPEDPFAVTPEDEAAFAARMGKAQDGLNLT